MDELCLEWICYKGKFRRKSPKKRRKVEVDVVQDIKKIRDQIDELVATVGVLQFEMNTRLRRLEKEIGLDCKVDFEKYLNTLPQIDE